MNHLTDEELILDYYGEIDREDQLRVQSHLAACGDCQAANAQLGSVLQLVETTAVPTARPGFERDVWARLEPHLEARTGGRPRWVAAPQWLLAGGVAALLVVAFVAGRFSGGPAAPAAGSGLQAGNSSERVLRAEVGEHLDRSQMMLVELVNTDTDQDVPAGEQSRAADLVSANRLFRHSAEQSGDTVIADILEDLERVLLEIANASADAPGERAGLQSRIQADGLLFRVRVIASEMRQRTAPDGGAGDPEPRRSPVS